MMGRLAGQLRVRQETKHIHPIVKAHNNNAFVSQIGAVVLILGSRAASVSATVDEHHDRQMHICSLGWSPNIQVKAVLADCA